MIADRTRLVIDGMCASACTVLADDLAAAGLVCVTPSAQLLYHQNTIVYRDGHSVRGNLGYHDERLIGWIAEQGGLPSTGVLTLSGSSAGALYPTCASS